MKALITQARAGFAGLAALLCAACAASEQPPPRAEAPPQAQPVAERIVTRTVTVSAPIVSACHLEFDAYKEPTSERAPKFAFDRAELSAQDRAVLAKVAECVTYGPLAGRSLVLVGRADPRGEVEYNMALGARRANSVAKYLESVGVSGRHLQQTSRGELDATGTDETGWAQDRRVDILLL